MNRKGIRLITRRCATIFGVGLPLLAVVFSLGAGRVFAAADEAKRGSISTALTPDEAVNVKVYKLANRAVVNISKITEQDLFYNVEPKGGIGSGTIISPDGLILTNYHVIEQANQIRVALYDGTSLKAKLVGSDPSTDLAIIKIDPPADKKLTTIPFGDSSRLEVGRRVFAIGNPFGFERTMTTGIISSVGRTLRTENGRIIRGILQTDAAINPGNSGGPLLNAQAEMIGINTAIYSLKPNGFAQSAGIGLAIPINIAKRIIPELIAHHGVNRPEIGLQGIETEKGLRVLRVDPNGPAAEAKISGPKLVQYKVGVFLMQQMDASFADVITKVDSVPVRSEDDLFSYIEQKKPGQVVTLTVLRSGKSIPIQVKLAAANTSES